MALDENIYELRRQKLKQIEALGQTAYRSKYEFTHTIPQILADYSGKTGEQLETPRVNVRVAGRIMAIRLMGKAGFCHLQQGGQRLQIYVKKDAVGEKGWELYKLLDLGDHIGVSGYLFRTRTGELTIHVDEITFLSKDLLPLPEKWHGLTDVELRYRQRYVDLVMNPEVREVFLKRSQAGAVAATHNGSAWVPRSRNPDDAADCRRCGRAAVRHAPQYARHGFVPAHRARALFETAGRGRIRSRLRNQPQFPQ